MNKYELDWNELAFSSKRPLRELKAVFIAAPREISDKRFTELVKKWLPKGNVILGLAKENYIDGFADQPHFRVLKQKTVQKIIDKVNNSSSAHKIYTLHYLQRDLNHILEKVSFSHHLFINGSWHKTFHTSPPYYTLVNNRRPYELVSPFTDETEARDYLKKISKEIKRKFPLPKKGSVLNEVAMMELMNRVSVYAFDYSYQNGLVLGKRVKGGYTFLGATYNVVVPFQTYAMHYGASREKNFTSPHDVSHYDTVHAEVEIIIKAATEKIDLQGTTVFVSTLPCPTCSRMLSETNIKEFIYQNDHSEGYAIAMFEAAGKVVRRVVPQNVITDV